MGRKQNVWIVVIIISAAAGVLIKYTQPRMGSPGQIVSVMHGKGYTKH